MNKTKSKKLTRQGEDKINSGTVENTKRKLIPEDIMLPKEYKIDVFAENLTTPINLIINDSGEMFLADAGVADGNGKLLKLIDGSFKVIAEGFNPPLTGINFRNGDIYVSHRGAITVVKPDGSKQDIILGLPSFGDHHNNQVMFGPDGKMYFGQGTATNSGVVGEDNREWVVKYPFFHDYPGCNVALMGMNYSTRNFLTASSDDTAFTGAYSPYGVPTMAGECIKCLKTPSGSILRANPDGSELECIAWGLRNPFRIKFDRAGRLFSTNHGADVRGSRPVNNSPDEFQLIVPGVWYGWPDYTGGLPVTNPMFKPEGKPQPQFLLAVHPMYPPKPFSIFEPHAAIMGFDFNYDEGFGPIGDVFIAEYGSEAPETTGGKPLPKVGHRVSRIDMKTGKITTFAMNKSGVAASVTGGGGFERPIDVVFGPDKAMYVLDFNYSQEEDEYVAGTGVIWRISRV